MKRRLSPLPARPVGPAEPGPHLVIDIGGGSTEFVTFEGGRSFDIGSVRLTDRVLTDRPAPPEQVATARAARRRDVPARDALCRLGDRCGRDLDQPCPHSSLAGTLPNRSIWRGTLPSRSR